MVLAAVHDFLLDELANNHVCLLYDLDHLRVYRVAIHLAIGDEPINLVQYEAHSNFLVPRLADDSVSLGRDALYDVNQHEATIRHAQGRADLVGENDVPGTIDMVDQVLPFFGDYLTILFLLLLVRVEDADGAGLHGDHALLLVLARVKITQLAGQFLVDEMIGCEERIGQGRLAVVDVREDADVPDAIGNLLQFLDFAKPGKALRLFLLLLCRVFVRFHLKRL